MTSAQVVILTAIGVLLAWFARWLFWAAINNTMKWATEKAGLCGKCGENATLVFSYEHQQVPMCEMCARMTFGAVYDETVRRGYLKKREVG